MPQSVLVEPVGETWEFPDEATPAQIQDAIGRQLSSMKGLATMDASPIELDPFKKLAADEGQPAPMATDPADDQQELLATTLVKAPLRMAGDAFRGLGEMTRAVVADVSAGLSLLKRPENQPPTAFPSPSNIKDSIAQNMQSAADASGNIPAAIQGKPLPIDTVISEAAKEDKGSATLAHLSQGLAASAPMLVALGGLPGALQKTAVAAFTVDMIRHAPKIATELGEQYGLPPEQRDQNRVAQLEAEAIQVVGFSALGVAHTVKSIGGAIEAMRLRRANAPATAAVVEEIRKSDFVEPADKPTEVKLETTELSPSKEAVPANPEVVQPESKGGSAAEIASLTPEEFSAWTKGKDQLAEQNRIAQSESLETLEAFANRFFREATNAKEKVNPESQKSMESFSLLTDKLRFFNEAVRQKGAAKVETPSEPLKLSRDEASEKLRQEGLNQEQSAALLGGKLSPEAAAEQVISDFNKRVMETTQPTSLGHEEAIRLAHEQAVLRINDILSLVNKEPESVLVEIINKRDRRDWSKLPASFQAEAVRAAFNDVKGLFPAKAVSQRIRASKATTFNELRKAINDAQEKTRNIPSGTREVAASVGKGQPKAQVENSKTVKPSSPEIQGTPVEADSSRASLESKPPETISDVTQQVTQTPTPERVRIGKSPQPFTVIERPKATEIEIANGEQPVKVRNDKTGEVQTVMEGDTKAIKGAQGALGIAPLTPSATPTVTLPVKSQRQIITDLAKGLDIPIRFGRLTTSKFGGYFKSLQNLIGIKRAGDLPTASHEVGHKLDDTFSLSKDPAIASELDVLGDPATAGSASSWTPSKGNSYKLGEGMAEFVRYWLTDPAKAKASAPNTDAAFTKILDANKDMGDTLRQAQSDIQVWRNSPAQARLRSQISVGDNPNKTPYTLSQLTRDVVDDLHILRKATEAAAEGVGRDLLPSENPYLLARNLRGSYGMADTFIRHGPVDFKTRAVEMGKSLQDALKPVAGQLNDFRDWIVAKRAQELAAQGRVSGIVEADANVVAKQFDANPDFQKAFTDIKEWQDKLLQYTEDAGLISKESAKSMRDMNADYVPFHRVFEVGAGEPSSAQGSGTGMGLNVGNPASLKRLRGSTRQIVDPLETMVKNAYTLITASEKANINRAVAELADKPGMGKWVERVATPKEKVQFELQRIKDQLTKAGADVSKLPDDLLLSFFKNSSRSPYGENIIRVIRGGQPEFYRLNRDLHDTFQALDLEDSGKLVKILSAPAQLLRTGVTLDPAFSLANVMRDTFSAAVISKYGALPLETTLKGFGAMIGNQKLVAEWAGSGGKSSVEAHFFDRAQMQKWLAQKISKDLTPAERATTVLKSPLTALRWISGTFEEATRIGEYKIALDKLQKGGMPEGEARRLAAFEARDRQDFAKGGARTKILRHMTAFWNAGLQANVKLASAFRRRPIKTLLAGFAFVTIPKLLEQAINWDDQDYWDRPQWERDAFFLIPYGKDKDGHTSFIRIPTPFEIGVIFGTIPGRILQYAKEKNADAVKDFPKVALKGAVPNPVPQWMQAIFENFLSGPKGWDTFRGRQIVPERIAELPLDQQYTEQTSRAAREIGKILGMSPMKVDHLIEQSTGGVGKILSGKQVPGQRFVTADLTQTSEPENQFYKKLEELNREAAGGKESEEHILINAFAQQVSVLRKAERESKDETEKRALREQILQLQKEALTRIGK